MTSIVLYKNRIRSKIRQLPPVDTLLLPPLESLHSATVRNQERPQPGESRPVLSPSQRTLSRQLMRAWEHSFPRLKAPPGMLEQLAFRTALTIHATNEQNLNSRPCADNAHFSVLAHEMMAIELCEKPTHAYLETHQPFSATSCVDHTMIGSPYPSGRHGFVQSTVFRFRL